MSPSQSVMSRPKWLGGRSSDEDKRLRKAIEKHQANNFVDAPVELVMRLDSKVLNGLPPEALERLPSEGWKRLTGETLARLPPDKISQLPLEDLRRLPPEAIVTLPAPALATLAKLPSIFSRLSPEQLGIVLPELEKDVLMTMPLDAIPNVNPRHLARMSQAGLAHLARRYPELYRLFNKLPHDELLCLPYYILDKLHIDRFQKIPMDVWLAISDESLGNLPPDIKKSLPKEFWARRSAQNELLPPTVSSMETQYSTSSPAPPDFPLMISQDGSVTPNAGSQVAPPVPPPRAHKAPPLAWENQPSTVKRTNSFSGSRSVTSSPSQDFRTPAIRYFQETPSLPERRGSKSTTELGDFRETPTYRPGPPPTPDGISRKDVPNIHGIMEELKKDNAAKSKQIEELESQVSQIQAKENWWKQRVDDENTKYVKLKLGIERIGDRIFNALETLAPGENLDRTHQDPIALVISKLESLNTLQQTSASRIFDCLEGIASDVSWDRSQPDPTGTMLEYLRKVHANASENFGLATHYRMKTQEEERKNDYLESQLDEKTKEARAAKDELSSVQYDLQESKKLLLLADGRESDYQMQITQLRRERDGYFKQIGELQRQIENERGAAQKNLENQRAHYEAQAGGIRQQNMDLQSQLNKQKETLAQEIRKQHIYYEDMRQKQESFIESLTTANAEAMNKAEQKREEDLKNQEHDFTQEIHKIHAHYNDLLKKEHDKNQKERQDHELALKHHAVNLQEKIRSLESDLVDNSDDFRPATDDSLKMSYGKLKLMVETITTPFNLDVELTIPQTFDPDNFVGREGNGQKRFLLRSIVWTALLDGFFSSPLGFGSFGPTHGKKLLLDTYSAWRKLFGDGPTIDSGFHAPDEVFERFRTDKEANKWRSATFQSILMAVNPKGQKKNQAANGHLVKPFADNRQKVHDDILGILRRVTNDQVKPEIAEKIVEIVQLAGELALEFGSQRAELSLGTLAKGDTIAIGAEFIDCEDGDSGRGKVKEVELLTLPKLFRIGDGRNDFKTRKIIVPGEIYPRQP